MINKQWSRPQVEQRILSITPFSGRRKALPPPLTAPAIDENVLQEDDGDGDGD